MLIRFKGDRKLKKTGCSKCGKKYTKGIELETIKRYYLPDGTEKIFRIGVAEDLQDSYAIYLLENFYYTDNDGNIVYCFERC